MAEDVHKWEPTSPAQIRQLLADLTIPWWIAGGWAIDLFVGRQTRSHGDMDVEILRRDQLIMQRYLAQWDLYKTNQPGLKPWLEGEYLGRGVNQFWCNPELTRAKQTIKELQTALHTAEARISDTEARAIAAEQRFAAAGDLSARLFAEEKRQRILVAAERWPELPAASVAIIAGASPGYVSEVLKLSDGRH